MGRNIAAPINVTAMHGIKAAKLLPSNNSPSVVGVASSGSRLFSIFSPTKLYDAIIEGNTEGIRTKYIDPKFTT